MQRIFIKNPCRHPIVILKDVEAEHLKIIIDFIYHGEMICTQDQLLEVLRVAGTLKVKGLTEVSLMKNVPNHIERRAPVVQEPSNATENHEKEPPAPIVAATNATATEPPNDAVRPGPKKKLKSKYIKIYNSLYWHYGNYTMTIKSNLSGIVSNR